MNVGGESGMQDRAAIGPPPYDFLEPEWPTYGYDGYLSGYVVDATSTSGRTREDWLSIADEMLSRWSEWRSWCSTAPDYLFLPSDEQGQ